MFVIEKFYQDHKARVEAWADARDSWVNAGSEYDYRSARDYERRNPRPGTFIKKVLSGLPVAIVISVICAVGVHFIGQQLTKPDEPKKEETAKVYNNGDQCKDFKKGDVGTIDYGDYQGAEVEIIGGCDKGQEYEVKVTKDQTLFAEGSEGSQYDDKNIKKDLVFKVNDSRNITVTGHNKE